MKKMKLKRPMMLILLFGCVFSLLAGCSTPETPTDPTVTDPTTVTDPSVPNRVLFNGMTDFMALQFADCGGFSWVYSLNIKVDDGEIYLNDIQYQEISKDDFEITHTSGYFNCADKEVKAADFFDMLNENAMHCLLETKSQSKIGKQIAVYEIDGRFYFLSFYDSNEVHRIHVSAPKTGE